MSEHNDCPKMHYTCPYYDFKYGCLSWPVCRLDIDFGNVRERNVRKGQETLI